MYCATSRGPLYHCTAAACRAWTNVHGHLSAAWFDRRPMVEGRWRSNEAGYDRYAYAQNNSPYTDPRLYRYHLPPGHPHCQHPPPPPMLRTRQFPEVAGIYGCEEQPALRRFTRYNHTMMDAPAIVAAPPPSTAFSKSSKKPSFFSGNWTFRDRKQSRPGVVPDGMRRDERPVSMNLSEHRSARSKSENSPRQVEVRVPMKIQRSADDELRRTRQNSETAALYKTNITVDDAAAVLRPKRDTTETNNNRYSYSSSNQLRKSCPDLETATATPAEDRGARRRNRRAKEKMRDACWRRKPVEDWALDDVLLWLQACSLDDVASLLIGYDLRGTDLLTWDHNCLSQLGVTSASIRSKILDELAAIRERGPEEPKESERKSGHRALFDIVKQSSYDQVLAVETPLTTRDIIVTHGRLGCLQITKVNGVNLPLRENDCLLEINDCPGEQFKSALMLTKLISDSNGAPIRFVVLRMKTQEHADDSSVSC
ncbi:hypothetical protein Y032_0041g445 [Ancylostoma ceylanicum]|uniref:SAM domain-containing protein n=1 Tax=Ancylostoma ceylanicum TaxID=53326 RepID=A0A016UH89_9BILA|nr:hypothetical protein Y032_0041g445 [Ancylostoma ceylanicum]